MLTQTFHFLETMKNTYWEDCMYTYRLKKKNRFAFLREGCVEAIAMKDVFRRFRTFVIWIMSGALAGLRMVAADIDICAATPFLSILTSMINAAKVDWCQELG